MTVLVFTFTSTSNKRSSNTSQHPLATIQCKNTSIPHFTLDYDANPSPEESEQLCTCIWDSLIGWEKEVALKLTSDKKDEISTIHMAGFPAIFGKRISECGGGEL